MMKLIRSQKNKEVKKQTEELYPKVKTFSGAYDGPHSAQDLFSSQSGPIRTFRPDERPYPVTPIPADAPVVPLSVDSSDPERIDLQDTLLTDESFTERIPERRPSVPEKPAAGPATSAARPEKVMEPETNAEPELAAEPEKNDWNAEPEEFEGPEMYSPDSKMEDDSFPAGAEADSEEDEDQFYVSESEDEYEPGPLDGNEPEPGFGTDLFVETDIDTDDEQESFFVPEPEAEDDPGQPVWSETVTESGSEPDEPEDLLDHESASESDNIEQLFPRLETKGKASLTAAWQPLPDADGYDLYFARSGESFGGVFRTLSPEETAFTFTDLDKKTVYKMRVSAFDLTCGQKTVICESDTVRSITGGSTKKHTNAAKIKIRESALDLSINEKKKISASVTGEDEDKQVLAHGNVLHYLSEDTAVATVSEEGKICAVAPGSCRVFVIAANGLRSEVNVTVHEKPAEVAFRKKKYPLEVGDSINLRKKLVSKPDKEEAGSMKWKSSDKEIAKISKKGILTALKKGQITVRVKTSEAGSAKVRIRITSPKKNSTVPWSGLGTGKKSSSDKKWSYLA